MQETIERPSLKQPNMMLRHFFSKYGTIAALLFLVVFFSLLSREFFSWYNFINIMRQSSIIGIVALGMAMTIIMGGIDLSVGSLLALSGVAGALIARQDSSNPVILAFIIPIAIGALSGMFIGSIVAWFQISPFIVTLGAMTISRGLALLLASGMPVTNVKPSFNILGTGRIAIFPVPVIIFLVVMLGSSFILRKMRFGRHLYAIGGNEQAAFAAGVNIKLTKLKMYLLLGSLTGLAGLVLAGRIRSGSPTIAVGYELDAIAACVVGGVSFTGGVGTALGAFIGTLIIGVINNGLDILNIQTFYQQIIKGFIIIVAVMIDRQKNR